MGCFSKVSFLYSLAIGRASTIEVGITQEMSVTVMVENRGENSYNTRVSLSYPHGLSYRTFTKTQVCVCVCV